MASSFKFYPREATVEPFHISLVLPNHELHWVEPTKTLAEAMARIAELGPGNYVVFSQTENKLAVKVPVAKEEPGEIQTTD
jgi:sarcosine oxidase gamma subunit